jgi:hypothetical protein
MKISKLQSLIFSGTAALVLSSTCMADVWHIVAFRFKTDRATQVKVPAAVKAFQDLQTLSLHPKSGKPLMTSFHSGRNNSTEQVSFGRKTVKADRTGEYTFVMTFDSLEDRDIYVDKDPAHAKFKSLVGPMLEGGAEGVFVTDFLE